MPKVLLSLSEQVAERLRQEIQDGLRRDKLPGRKQLAEEFGCSDWTVYEAIQMLKNDGLLVSPGAGSRPQIVTPKAKEESRALKIMFLLHENSVHESDYVVSLLKRLREAGCEADFARHSMQALGMDFERIKSFVERTEADAWIVLGGWEQLLDWFSHQSIPAFALFGQNLKVPMASFSLLKPHGLARLTDQLVEYGHRRIVMIGKGQRRNLQPGSLEQGFMNRLKEHGIEAGTYHLPDWGSDPKDLNQYFVSTFRNVAPTALIVNDASLCIASLLHLNRLGLSLPNDVSLVCTDTNETFKWCEPKITHITWDSEAVIQSVLKWTNNLLRGWDDRSKETNDVKVIHGGTIGPAKVTN